MTGPPLATIREARPSDLAAALPLWLALHHEHESLDPRYRLADDAGARWSADFREWTRSRTSRVWLAVGVSASHPGGRSEPAGLVTAHLYVPTPTFEPESLVHVDDLFVAPGARGTGLGARLLDHARQWGAAQGATQLRAGVLAANAAGRAFWTRQGTQDFSVTVTMPVGDG